MCPEEINNRLIDTGCWWFNPWWLEDRWYDGIGIQKKEIIEAIDLLKGIFTPDWVRSLGADPLRHPFLKKIHLGKGIGQLSDIYALANRLKSVLKLEGHKPVIDSYKKIEQASSADLELFMAYVMVEAGYDVSFIRAKAKKGRTPDIQVKLGGKEFVVECKSLKDSATEQWFQNYSREFSGLVMRSIPAGCEVGYRPNNLKLDPSDYGYPKYGSYELAAAIDALPIIRKLQRVGLFSVKHQFHNLGAKGELCILPSGLGLTSQMVMPEITQAFVSRRLLGNGVKKASVQILEYGSPGIISVFYASPPDIGMLKRDLLELFADNRETYRLVTGVLIFPAQNLFRYIPPIWVANPYADYQSEDYGLPGSLSKMLDPLT